jgi:hypothetical protein
MIVYKLKYESYQQAVLGLMNKGVFINSKLDYSDDTQAVVFIGKIQITEGTYDEQDRVITEPTYEDGYFVDVMSSKEIQFDNIVTPSKPYHKFAGQ